MLKLQVLILWLVSLHWSLAYTKYDGHQVLQFHPTCVDDHTILAHIIEEFQLDVWRHGEDVIDVMVASSDMISILQDSGIPFDVMIDDVGRLVSESFFPSQNDLNISKFYTVDEIHTFLEDQAAVCGVDCIITDIGLSYEGRPLKTIKISRPGSNRRAIWVDGGMHAREWLSPAVATFFVDKLINDYGVDPDVTLLRDTYDWYIHPVVNPDGYQYTWTTDRMWRKTRSPNPPTSCVGTDPNRNYDIQWGPGNNDTCSDVYQGPSAESELEIAAYTSYVLSIASSLDLLMSYHTYGEILVMPWGYSTVEPPDIADLERLAGICIDAMNVNSTLVYEWGQVGNPTGGMSMDWARGVAGVKYSYVMEMRGGQTGYGFLAPPSEILPTALENWAGVVAMVKDIIP